MFRLVQNLFIKCKKTYLVGILLYFNLFGTSQYYLGRISQENSLEVNTPYYPSTNYKLLFQPSNENSGMNVGTEEDEVIHATIQGKDGLVIEKIDVHRRSPCLILYGGFIKISV